MALKKNAFECKVQWIINKLINFPAEKRNFFLMESNLNSLIQAFHSASCLLYNI